MCESTKRQLVGGRGKSTPASVQTRARGRGVLPMHGTSWAAQQTTDVCSTFTASQRLCQIFSVYKSEQDFLKCQHCHVVGLLDTKMCSVTCLGLPKGEAQGLPLGSGPVLCDTGRAHHTSI